MYASGSRHRYLQGPACPAGVDSTKWTSQKMLDKTRFDAIPTGSLAVVPEGVTITKDGTGKYYMVYQGSKCLYGNRGGQLQKPIINLTQTELDAIHDGPPYNPVYCLNWFANPTLSSDCTAVCQANQLWGTMRSAKAYTRRGQANSACECEYSDFARCTAATEATKRFCQE